MNGRRASRVAHGVASRRGRGHQFIFLTSLAALPCGVGVGCLADCASSLQGKREIALYAVVVASANNLKVSKRGQMSLPVTARRRWGLIEGGRVGFLDLGDGVLLVPGGIEELRQELLGSVSDQEWAEARTGFGDPDLVSE